MFLQFYSLLNTTFISFPIPNLPKLSSSTNKQNVNLGLIVVWYIIVYVLTKTLNCKKPQRKKKKQKKNNNNKVQNKLITVAFQTDYPYHLCMTTLLMTDSICHSSLQRTVLEKVTLTTIQFHIHPRTKVDQIFQCMYICMPLKSCPYKNSATCA